MTRTNITRDMSFQVNTDTSAESNGRTMEGYAALFNEPTEINSAYEGNFTERIAPGAFKKTLEGGRLPKLQWNHGKDTRVGATPIGVYDDIKEDGKGLRVKGTLFDNPVVEPVRQAIESGAVDGMSFTFQVVRDEWHDGDGNPVTGRDLQRKLFDGQSSLYRNIKEVKLLEAGPVLFPAYSGTSVGVRATEEIEGVDRAAIIAEYMRSGGMPVTDLDKEDVSPVQNNDSTVGDPDNGTDGQDEAVLTEDLTKDAVPEDVTPPDSTIYADPGYQSDKQPRFPLDTPENIDAALAQIADPAVACQYTEEQLALVKANLDAVSGDTDEMKDDGTPVAVRADADANTPYGDVAYADPGYQTDGKKRYPLDTDKHIRAAWGFINEADNASVYTSDQLTKIKSKISAAAKKIGVDISSTDETKSDSTDAAIRTSAVEEKKDSAAQSTLSTQESNTDKKRNTTMTLAELREQLAAIAVRQEDLATEYRNREMPDAEDVEYEDLKTERAKVEASIAKVEARLEEFKEAAASQGKHIVGGSDAPAYIKSRGEEIYNVETLRRDSYSDEDLRNRLRESAMHAADIAKFGGGKRVNREDAQEQIERLLVEKDDTRGTLAQRMLVTGSAVYERAWSKAAAAGNRNTLNTEESRALELGVSADGGYAVPFQLDPTIIWTTPGVINPLRDICRVEQIVGKQWQGVVSSGTTVTRSAEAAEATDNSFALTQPVVDTQRVMGFIPFTYEIAESWGQVRTEITTSLVDAKGREEAASFINGNGTGTQANGLLGTLSGNPNVTSSASSTLTASNVYNLETALDPRWRANGSFLAHRSIYNLIRQFDTAGGAQLWERIGAGLPNELLGYSAYESSVMNTAPLTTGNVVGLFGDFQQFLIVDRIGMSVELIPQIFGPARQMPTGQRGIFAIWMNNSLVLTPNAFATLTSS